MSDSDRAALTDRGGERTEATRDVSLSVDWLCKGTLDCSVLFPFLPLARLFLAFLEVLGDWMVSIDKPIAEQEWRELCLLSPGDGLSVPRGVEVKRLLLIGGSVSEEGPTLCWDSSRKTSGSVAEVAGSVAELDGLAFRFVGWVLPSSKTWSLVSEMQGVLDETCLM